MSRKSSVSTRRCTHSLRQRKCVEAAGLLFRPDFPWLGASPDGIVPLDNALVEVKRPFVCRDTSFSDAAKTSTFCLKSTSDGLCFRRKHAYY